MCVFYTNPYHIPIRYQVTQSLSEGMKVIILARGAIIFLFYDYRFKLLDFIFHGNLILGTGYDPMRLFETKIRNRLVSILGE